MKRSTTTVVGLGCIGGSIATALNANGALVRGWSTSGDDCARARELHIDVPDRSLAQAVAGARLVIIAVPVQAIAAVAAVVTASAPAESTIIHCGGVQSRPSLHLDEAASARVIGAHPLAGSHESGFAAARADLFAGCRVSIESRASDEARERNEWLWNVLGAMRLDYRSAEEHDAMMVWISHLPQLVSTALAATFAAEHIDPESVGPGARDTTRLAASAFEQWSSLVQAQPVVLDAALAKLESSVAGLRAALSRGDQRALRTIWDAASDWRRSAEPPSS